MSEDPIRRLRSPGFPTRRRGYDPESVDRFLAELADWLEGEFTGPGAERARRELEAIGDQTGRILAEAHDAAQAMRVQAEREVRKLLAEANLRAEELRTRGDEYAQRTREEADLYALKARGDADGHAERARIEAETYAQELAAKTEAEAAQEREQAEREAAEARAAATRDGERRRAELAAEVADLEQRRDAALAELERLANEVAGTATQHRSARTAPARSGHAEGPQRAERGDAGGD